MNVNQQDRRGLPQAKTKRRPGRRWANLLLLVTATVVALTIAEIAFRLLGLGRPPFVLNQESPDIFVHSTVPGLSYGLRPNFAGRAFGAQMWINSHGMRGPEVHVEKPAAIRRVLILGDSVAFGHGVGQGEVFSAVLEQILNGWAATSPTVEVLNASVPGYNAQQHRIYLETKGLAFQPDVVVIAAVLNDVEPAHVLRPSGKLEWENTPEVYREAFERHFSQKGMNAFLKRHLRVFAVLNRPFERPYLVTGNYLGYLDSLYTPDAAGWREAQQAWRAIKTTCRERGIGLIFAYCPVMARPEPKVLRRIRGEYADFARREKMTFIDLYDAQADYPLRRLVISSLDRHPSILGHRLMAEALAPLVREMLGRNSKQTRGTEK